MSISQSRQSIFIYNAVRIHLLLIFLLVFGSKTLLAADIDQPLFECVRIHESNVPKACQPFVTYDSIAVPQGANVQLIQANTEYQLRLWLASDFDCRNAATRYICFNAYRYCDDIQPRITVPCLDVCEKMAEECEISTSTCSEDLPVYSSKPLPCFSTDFNEPEASDELYDMDFACPNHLHWSFENKQCSLLCPTDNNPDGYYLAMKILSYIICIFNVVFIWLFLMTGLIRYKIQLRWPNNNVFYFLLYMWSISISLLMTGIFKYENVWCKDKGTPSTSDNNWVCFVEGGVLTFTTHAAAYFWTCFDLTIVLRLLLPTKTFLNLGWVMWGYHFFSIGLALAGSIIGLATGNIGYSNGSIFGCTYGNYDSDPTEIDWYEWGLDLIPYMVVQFLNTILIIIAITGIIVRTIRTTKLKKKALLAHIKKDWRILCFFVYYWTTLTYITIYFAIQSSNPLKTDYYNNIIDVVACLLSSTSSSQEEKCWDNRGRLQPHYASVMVSTLLILSLPTVAFIVLGLQKHFVSWWWNWLLYIKKKRSVTFDEDKLSLFTKSLSQASESL